jgi:hypothetical protein
MPTSLIAADSLLAIDVGSVHSRAALFDVVDGRYRYIASGVSETTANAPHNDISEGIHTAIDRLRDITGRVLIGDDERLIIPGRPDGMGVDVVTATLSAGPPMKIIAVGLLEDVSLESAVNLATTTYGMICERIGLNDHRKTDERISAIIRAKPDLIIVTGGTDGGASHSVLKLLEAVGLGCYLQEGLTKPEILFAGNQALQAEVKSLFSLLGNLHFAPNVRPILDFETLDAAQVQLANLFRHIRTRQLPGVNELDSWSNGHLLPTSMAIGQLIRSLSKVYGSNKGVLGVDIGASATTIAVAFSGELTLGVYPQFGIGSGLPHYLNYGSVKDISRWLRFEIPDDYVRNYLQTKAIYPASIPTTDEDLDVEQALARQMMRQTLYRMAPRLKTNPARISSGIMPFFEPILASGSVLTQPADIMQTLLMLLDGLQPAGVTTLVLDKNHLMAGLGAAMTINPILAVQAIDYGAFLSLGVVISTLGNYRYGTPVMQLQMVHDNGSENKVIVRQGDICVLSLPAGHTAEVIIQCLHRCDVGMGGPGRGGRLRVVGGEVGVVIDARGRPLRLSNDPGRRREQFSRWQRMLHSQPVRSGT